MHDQPYYFELIPRTIISNNKSQQKQQGQFRFHVQKSTQQVDFTRQGLKAEFNQNRMPITNTKLNFFLANYITGKHTTAQFTLQLTKKPNYSNNQQSLGSYLIDANIYIQQFKSTQQNHFAQVWDLSENYKLEVEIYFAQSRYLLEQLLKVNRGKYVGEFKKAMVSKALEEVRKEELEEEMEVENQEKYNEKRVELMNKYSGAIVGHGGYRIFTEEEERRMQRKAQQQSRKPENPLIKKASQQSTTKPTTKKQSTIQRPKIKHTQSITIGSTEQQFSHNQIKNIKYLILVVVILIVTGTVYFTSKVVFKDDSTTSVVIEKDNDNEENFAQSKKSSGKKQKKAKSKKPKKGQL